MISTVLLAYNGTREGRAGLFEFTKVIPAGDVQIHLLAVVRVADRLSVLDAPLDLGQGLREFEDVEASGVEATAVAQAGEHVRGGRQGLRGLRRTEHPP